MGVTQHFIKPGFVRETKEENNVYGFHLEGWLKRVLRKFGVAFADPCCAEPNEVPVRYNKTSHQFEALVNGAWGNTSATPAPTTGVVDDTANTFNFTYATGFTSNSDYEQTLNGGTTVTALSAKPITGLTGARNTNTVGVRVKALGARPASAWLYNGSAYTV